MQAVMGTLVKRFLAKQLGLDPAQVYHCAVMPCYDKKLEGSRDDFMIPGVLPGQHAPHKRCMQSLTYASMLMLTFHKFPLNCCLLPVYINWNAATALQSNRMLIRQF